MGLVEAARAPYLTPGIFLIRQIFFILTYLRESGIEQFSATRDLMMSVQDRIKDIPQRQQPFHTMNLRRDGKVFWEHFSFALK